MRSVRAEILAIFNSRKIAAFLNGVEVSLPNCEQINIKVKNSYRAIRSPGLRFSKFSYVSEVHAGDQVGFGYGESESQLLSSQKSIVEGVERAIYKLMKNRNPEIITSNGWAAHLSKKQAQVAAAEELYERDAILSHWLCEKPFIEVELSSAPKWITDWARKELSLHPRFKHLRILTTTEGFLPVAMTLLQSDEGYSLMSQASASSLEGAIYKALAETCRIGEVEAQGNFKSSSLKLAQGLVAESAAYTPIDHAMVYAYHIPVPNWVFGPTKTWPESARLWKNNFQQFQKNGITAEFNQIVAAPIVVGYCSNQSIQNLFFGRTVDADKRGLLNRNRLWKVKQSDELCLLPHCVP